MNEKDNESRLELGSMLPQVEWAREHGVPVLVMNPNENYVEVNGRKEAVPICGSMNSHATYVWKHFVMKSGIGKLLVIAHSAGGGCVGSIMSNFPDHFFSSVIKIAYTDSWVMSPYNLHRIKPNFMMERAIHFKASRQPLG